MPTTAQQHLGPLSQSEIRPLIRGPRQILEHPGLHSLVCQEPALSLILPTNRPTPALGLPKPCSQRAQDLTVHRRTNSSSGTPWALVPPTSRLTSTPRHLGPLSQQSQDPVSLTSRPTPALGHPRTCSQPVLLGYQEPA